MHHEIKYGLDTHKHTHKKKENDATNDVSP